MGKSIHINTKLIIPIVLSIAIFILFSMLFYFEMRIWDRVIIPFFVTCFIAMGMYYFLSRTFEDKFVSKIFLISILLHFAFMIFWQLLKYYGMGLQFPTESIFNHFISDSDGVIYHPAGVDVSNFLNTHHLTILRKKMVGGLFPKIIGIIYYFSGTHNPFLVCCVNSLCAGLTAPIIYYIGKVTLKDLSLAKLYSLFSIITFSHIMNTSVLMRDVYITIFIYLSIFLSYLFYKTKKPIYLIATLFSIYCLKAFRPYACYIIFMSIIASYLLLNIKIIKQGSKLKVNKITMGLIILSPVILVLLVYIFIKLTHTFGVITSAEDLINIRDTAYVGGNADMMLDYSAMYSIFPPLPFIVGTICMFFAPFPWEWFVPRRIIYVPDMLMLYCLIPSFFKNIKLVFSNKNYILIVFIFAIVLQFSIYCITLGNTGAIHRNRGPFIPMIYLIAMYRPDKYLSKLLTTVQKWRII